MTPRWNSYASLILHGKNPTKRFWTAKTLLLIKKATYIGSVILPCITAAITARKIISTKSLRRSKSFSLLVDFICFFSCFICSFASLTLILSPFLFEAENKNIHATFVLKMNSYMSVPPLKRTKFE